MNDSLRGLPSGGWHRHSGILTPHHPPIVFVPTGTVVQGAPAVHRFMMESRWGSTSAMEDTFWHSSGTFIS